MSRFNFAFCIKNIVESCCNDLNEYLLPTAPCLSSDVRLKNDCTTTGKRIKITILYDVRVRSRANEFGAFGASAPDVVVDAERGDV